MGIVRCCWRYIPDLDPGSIFPSWLDARFGVQPDTIRRLAILPTLPTLDVPSVRSLMYAPESYQRSSLVPQDLW